MRLGELNIHVLRIDVWSPHVPNRGSKMTPDDRMNVMHYLFATAWADGTLAEEEGEILATILSGMELGDEELGLVKMWFRARPEEPDWTLLKETPDLQEIVIRQAMVLAGSDLTYDIEEVKFLEKLRDLTGMENSRFQKIWQDVEQLLAQGRAG